MLNTAAAKRFAPVFAALGDETRLMLVTKLAKGQPRSIAQLTEGSKITRQAMTKHLRVLEEAGVVTSSRTGRESQFMLEPIGFKEMEQYLQYVGQAWESSLHRLKRFVESTQH
jgi:DNA-binding transcriptional ArsR family regulator